jgi:hypothetical protein
MNRFYFGRHVAAAAISPPKSMLAEVVFHSKMLFYALFATYIQNNSI